MLSPWFDRILSRSQLHSTCYVYALAIIAAGIPFSRFLMSLGGILLIANWVIEGHWQQKRDIIIHHKPLLIFLCLMGVHVFFLLFSSHVANGLKDIWIKLPLVYIPVIMATSPAIGERKANLLLKVYVIAAIVSITCGSIAYLQHGWTEKRLMALYISYARMEINVCFAFFVSMYIAWQEQHKATKILYTVLGAILAAYLIYAGFLTGILLLLTISMVCGIIYARSITNRGIKYGIYGIIGVAAISIIAGTCIITYRYFHTDFNIHTAPACTAYGHAYTHHMAAQHIENGSYIYTCVCEEELEPAWNRCSHIAYDSVNNQGYCLRNTLIRYLNSKHLTKDRAGIEALTGQDITNIEHGIANYHYKHSCGIIGRYYSTLWEINDYIHTGYMVGYSLPQRFELWKKSLHVIRQYPISGVGTGDTRAALSREMETQDSLLKHKEMKSHNEYLSFFMAFGCIGFIICLVAIFYPALRAKPWPALFAIFMAIMLLSMLTEDTLDQQDGATLFAFFYSLYVFARPQGQ